MMHPDRKSKLAPRETIVTATNVLVAFARSQEGHSYVASRSPGWWFVQALAAAENGEVQYLKSGPTTLTRFVADFLGPIIKAEGPGFLADSSQPGWAKITVRKYSLLNKIEEQYIFSVSDRQRPDSLDRSTPEWCAISRRNVTVPAGLVYEVEAVRRRLSESKKKISFSGFIEVAIREFLKRPIDSEDARFYDADIDDFEFQPEFDTRTVLEIVAESEIRGRRQAAPVSVGP